MAAPSVNGVWRGVEAVALAALVTAFVLMIEADTVRATLNGAFADPDDALRLVEVRRWLAGASWFDLSVPRLDPDHPVFMHWSRLVDLPVAALIKLFALVVPEPRAERLTAVVLPALYLFGLTLALRRLGRVMFGADAARTLVLGLAFSGTALVVFGPSRIGHHAPETLALVLATSCVTAAFDPRRAVANGLAAGALIALALAMSLETLPFLSVLMATLVGLWIWRGTALRPALTFVAIGLGVCLPLLDLISTTQVAARVWGSQHPPCDQIDRAHVLAGVAGSVGLVAISHLPPIARRLWTRALAATVLAGGLVVLVRSVNPFCLASPFAQVDPLVVDLWQNHVRDSLPLPRMFAEQPMLTNAAALPLALSLAAGAFALTRLHGLAFLRLVPVLALTTAGLALSFWQVRVLTSAAPLGLCAALAGLMVAQQTLRARGWNAGARVLPLGILFFTPTIWLILLPADQVPAETLAAQAAKRTCLSPQALAPLASVPAGAIVGPLDLGSHLLEATPHSVYAGPYHRDNDGILFDFHVFLSTPEAAHALLDARHATYVLTCPGSNDMSRLATRAPAGLAAALEHGQVPAFLTPVPLDGSPLRLYRVTP